MQNLMWTICTWMNKAVFHFIYGHWNFNFTCQKELHFWFIFNHLKIWKSFFLPGPYENRQWGRFELRDIVCQLLAIWEPAECASNCIAMDFSCLVAFATPFRRDMLVPAWRDEGTDDKRCGCDAMNPLVWGHSLTRHRVHLCLLAFAACWMSGLPSGKNHDFENLLLLGWSGGYVQGLKTCMCTVNDWALKLILEVRR